MSNLSLPPASDSPSDDDDGDDDDDDDDDDDVHQAFCLNLTLHLSSMDLVCVSIIALYIYEKLMSVKICRENI